MTEEETRIRKVEDALLLLPTQLTSIEGGQEDIKEHLEIIDGALGEFDDRIHSVETRWDYQDKRKEEKKEDKKSFISTTNVIIAGIAITQGVIVTIFALS